jgi:hypothetical protein
MLIGDFDDPLSPLEFRLFPLSVDQRMGSRRDTGKSSRLPRRSSFMSCSYDLPSARQKGVFVYPK